MSNKKRTGGFETVSLKVSDIFLSEERKLG